MRIGLRAHMEQKRQFPSSKDIIIQQSKDTTLEKLHIVFGEFSFPIDTTSNYETVLGHKVRIWYIVHSWLETKSVCLEYVLEDSIQIRGYHNITSEK